MADINKVNYQEGCFFRIPLEGKFGNISSTDARKFGGNVLRCWQKPRDNYREKHWLWKVCGPEEQLKYHLAGLLGW
jgi:hypothetical protein